MLGYSWLIPTNPRTSTLSPNRPMTARMDMSRSKISLSATQACSYPRCEDQRFAQHRLCPAHFEKMSWIVNRSWHRPAMWTGAAVVAMVVLVLIT
jgi:hypothetical protein